ncbi:MAG: hypothetical protein ACKO47_02820 [Alphaproteobacteria bacterium]
MSKQNEPLDKIQEAIKEQERIVNDKKSGEEGGVISKNPKATLAITAVIFAVLVIGMIAAFGGVGMIDGAMLGKVLLTGATVGTALYGGYKVFKAIKGDKDQKNLASLKKVKQDIQRSGAKDKLREAQEELKNTLQLENDKQLVKRLLAGNEYKVGEDEHVNYKDAKGREQTQKIGELSEQQKYLYDIGKAKKELEEAIKELSKTKIQNADTQLETLMSKLGVTDFDKNKTGTAMVTQITDAVDNVIKSNGTSQLEDDDKNRLKEILRACVGVGSDGNKIGADKTDYLDGKSRLVILTSLKDALDGADPTKFKADTTAGKDIPTTLSEIHNKIATEKGKTKERANQVGRAIV